MCVMALGKDSIPVDKKTKEDLLNTKEKKEAGSTIATVYRMDELKKWYEKRVSSDWLDWWCVYSGLCERAMYLPM